jgi:hypothetical protein
MADSTRRGRRDAEKDKEKDKDKEAVVERDERFDDGKKRPRATVPVAAVAAAPALGLPPTQRMTELMYSQVPHPMMYAPQQQQQQQQMLPMTAMPVYNKVRRFGWLLACPLRADRVHDRLPLQPPWRLCRIVHH